MRNGRRRSALLVAAGIVLCGFIFARAVDGSEPVGVSLVQLLSDPDGFDGKLVRLVGFCWLEQEGNGLYLHREDFDHRILKNALWLEVGPSGAEKYGPLSGRYILVEAVFDTKSKGHGGLFSGTLRDIRRAQAWPPRADLQKSPQP